MNPQRIEEFRKKLREGHAVRVHKGDVTLDETRPHSNAPNASAPNPPAPQGVQVKPHEWGDS